MENREKQEILDKLSESCQINIVDKSKQEKIIEEQNRKIEEYLTIAKSNVLRLFF